MDLMALRSVTELPVTRRHVLDPEILRTVAAVDRVGDLIRRHRQKAALGEAMRLVGEANKYVADTQPFKLKGEDPATQARLATVLHTLAQVVTDLNLMLSPFLPHAANATIRQLGLLFFLAAIGLASGPDFAASAFSTTGLKVGGLAALAAPTPRAPPAPKKKKGALPSF